MWGQDTHPRAVVDGDEERCFAVMLPVGEGDLPVDLHMGEFAGCCGKVERRVAVEEGVSHEGGKSCPVAVEGVRGEMAEPAWCNCELDFAGELPGSYGLLDHSPAGAILFDVDQLAVFAVGASHAARWRTILKPKQLQPLPASAGVSA